MAATTRKSRWFMPFLIGMIIGWYLSIEPKRVATETSVEPELDTPVEVNEKPIARADESQDLVLIISKSDQNAGSLESALKGVLYSGKDLGHLSAALNECYESFQELTLFSSHDQRLNDAAFAFANVAQIRCEYYKRAESILEEKPSKEWSKSINEFAVQTKYLRESLAAQTEEGRRSLLAVGVRH